MKPTRRFPKVLTDRYIKRGSDNVDGWFEKLDQHIIRAIGDCQTERGITGAVGEIGVYHGRLFILLYLMLHAHEQAFCVDVFEQFGEAKAWDPRGVEHHFLENLHKHVGSNDKLEIFRSRSEDISPNDITRAVGSVRLFSIDGGHTAETTENDLKIANACLSDKGIIALDDFHNRTFPGVAQGVHGFFASKPDLVPFVIGHNKLYLCRSGCAEIYQRAVIAKTSAHLMHQTEFYGHPVDIYDQTVPKWLRQKQPYSLRHLSRRFRKRVLKPAYRPIAQMFRRL